MKTKLLLLAALSLLSTGCVYTKYRHYANGDRELIRYSFGGNQRIGKVDLISGTMSGYTSEQSEALGAMAEGFARGVTSGAAK